MYGARPDLESHLSVRNSGLTHVRLQPSCGMMNEETPGWSHVSRALSATKDSFLLTLSLLHHGKSFAAPGPTSAG
jgi:hypothetical protein